MTLTEAAKFLDDGFIVIGCDGRFYHRHKGHLESTNNLDAGCWIDADLPGMQMFDGLWGVVLECTVHDNHGDEDHIRFYAREIAITSGPEPEEEEVE